MAARGGVEQQLGRVQQEVGVAPGDEVVRHRALRAASSLEPLARRLGAASSSRKLPRPSTSSRWMRTPSQSSSRRLFSTTTSVPQRRVQRLAQGRRLADRHAPVVAHARAGLVGAAVLDQLGVAGVLLAQLEAAVRAAEVGVALGDLAAILGAQLKRQLERAARIRVAGLDLEVALRGCQWGIEANRFRAHAAKPRACG